MSIAEMIYSQVKLLPEPQAQRVLDFIVTLREGRDAAEWHDLMRAQAGGLNAAWDNAEDEVWNHV